MNHCAVHLKLTQYRKSTILQYKIKSLKKKKKNWQIVLLAGLGTLLSSPGQRSLSAVRAWLPGAWVTPGHCVPGCTLMGRQGLSFHMCLPLPPAPIQLQFTHVSLLKMLCSCTTSTPSLHQNYHPTRSTFLIFFFL